MCLKMSIGSSLKLLSSEIKTLLKGDNAEEYSYNKCYESGEFIENFVFNWDEIGKLFEPEFLKNSHPPLTYENCTRYVKILRPVWRQSLEALYFNKQYSDAVHKYLKWTGNTDIIKTFLDLPTAPTSVVEGCLLLTAVLENALGNVFYTITSSNPPHLLRDLLNTSELRKLFSPFPIFFLQILMGTPNSVNLRNILWHGFPSPDDIAEYYLAVLIISSVSFSHMLEKMKFNIKFRQKVTFPETYFKDKQFEIYCFEDELVQKIIMESKLVPNTHKIYWEQIYKYFREERYQQFLVLILPQIELILRVIYAECNQVDISAKLDEYYIIIDTIFEETVPNQPAKQNKIFSHLDTGTLKLLYDLFMAPCGPRIRDKVSHGEVDFNSIDKSVSSVLLLLSLNLLKNCRSDEFNISQYESRFHPNGVTFDKIKNLDTLLDEIKKIQIPEELKHFVEWSENNIVPNDEFSNLKEIKIFLRPKQENEIITILYKISHCIEQSCKNLINSFETRFILYSEKQLRSKRRRTLVNMLRILPSIYDTLALMLQEMQTIFYVMQVEKMKWDSQNLKNTLRFLKQFLKCVENLCKYCSIDRNEWERAANVCLTFKTNLHTFQINYFQ